MQKFWYSSMLLLIFLSMMFFFGCQDGSTDIIDVGNAGALANSVWAGETPREGDWLTITFRPEGKVIWSFSVDNTTNLWDYTFNDNNAGTISSPGGSWNPAPNGFTVSGNTLTITNYGSHGGAPRDFRRVRQTNFTVDPVPFTLGALAGNLVGSVWAGHTPIAGAWLTITFRPNNRVIMSFTHDNTSNEWEYTWNNNEGTIVTDGWPLAPNGFSIGGNTLSITNFGNHNPDATPPVAHNFRRYR